MGDDSRLRVRPAIVLLTCAVCVVCVYRIGISGMLLPVLVKQDASSNEEVHGL